MNSYQGILLGRKLRGLEHLEVDLDRRHEREHGRLQRGVRAAEAAEPHLPRRAPDDVGERAALPEDAGQHLRHPEREHTEHDDRSVRKLSTPDGYPLGK